MSPSLQQWESDPLFSAAEVVQDSADRMESIFRLLLHEVSVAQGDHSDPKLLASVDCHRLDLATVLETTKWQLEDFQRAVSLSLTPEKSQMKDDMISRHRQFIRAIREHIMHVEKCLEDRSVGNLVRNNEWVNLNEEDRYGLALFLSGGGPSEQSNFSDSGDNGTLRRFLDSAVASRAKDGALRNGEHDSIEIEALNVNGIGHKDDKFDSRKEMNSRRAGSYTSMQMGIEATGFLPETSRGLCVEEGHWDLEASEAEPKNFFEENKLRRFQRLKVVGFFNHIWTAYVGRFARNYMKRLKDGEEQSDSPSATNASNDFQNWLGTCRARYQRSLDHIQLNRHFVQLISLAIFALLVLGVVVFRIA